MQGEPSQLLHRRIRQGQPPPRLRHPLSRAGEGPTRLQSWGPTAGVRTTLVDNKHDGSNRDTEGVVSVGQRSRGRKAEGGDLPAGPSSWPGSSRPAPGAWGQEAASPSLCHPSSSALTLGQSWKHHMAQWVTRAGAICLL